MILEGRQVDVRRRLEELIVRHEERVRLRAGGDGVLEDAVREVPASEFIGIVDSAILDRFYTAEALQAAQDDEDD